MSSSSGVESNVHINKQHSATTEDYGHVDGRVHIIDTSTIEGDAPPAHTNVKVHGQRYSQPLVVQLLAQRDVKSLEVHLRRKVAPLRWLGHLLPPPLPSSLLLTILGLLTLRLLRPAPCRSAVVVTPISMNVGSRAG